MKRLSGLIWLIVIVLSLLWLAGIVAGMSFGGLLHLLLVVALIALVVEILRGLKA